MQQLNKYIITNLGTEEVSILSQQDNDLITSFHLNDVPFYADKYQVDLRFYDLNQNFVETISDISSYTLLGNNQQDNITEITVDPVNDGLDNGYLGDVILKYEVSNNLFSPSKEQDVNSNLFIVEVSADRTEIRAKAANLSSKSVSTYISKVSTKLNSGTYFPDIFLNFFQSDINITVTNIVLETVGTTKYVTVKLYEPLPNSIDVKDQFYIKERIGGIAGFKVVRDVELIPDTAPSLRKPNFSIDVEESSTNITDYIGYGELLSYPLNTSYKQLYSIFKDKGIELGIDHTDFSQFIHFSSAVERLENFRYKLSLIQSYEDAAGKILSTTEKAKYNKLIEDIISNFDHYDRFLYFDNDPKAWPKTNSNRPYINVSTEASELAAWWETIIEEASYYDSNNPDILINSIPTGLREDINNEPYLVFVHMIAQHFDNEWIYAKAVGDRYNADNRLDHGISKDLVRDAIASFGIDICKSNQNLTALFEQCKIDGTYDNAGETSVQYFKKISTGETIDVVRIFDGRYAPVEAIQELLNGSSSISMSYDRIFNGMFSDAVTRSNNNDWQPILVDTYRKEVYKRIYHNLPLLLKTKGTNRGLRALINCFGIPDNILTITVQGGTNLGNKYFGPEAGTTSSIDRVRVIPSGSDTIVPFTYISGAFQYIDNLDRNISVEREVRDRSKDSNVVDLGFDLTKQFDVYAQKTLTSFDYNNIIGDSRNTEENYGEAFSLYRNQILAEASSSRVEFRSPSSIIRLVRYIDSTFYRSIQDFIPARDSVSVGVVAKDNILHRNRYAGLKQSGLETEVHTGSIQMDSIEAGSGGSINGELDTDYSQSWSTFSGTGSKAVFGGIAKFDGELSGSTHIVTDGELIKRNLWDNQMYDYNPFAHAGGGLSTYGLNFKFMCLPGAVNDSLLLQGINIARRTKVYNYYGSVSYNYSYGFDIYDAGNRNSVVSFIDGGTATSELSTLGGGTANMMNKAVNQQAINQGAGDALMYAGVQQLELTANTSSIGEHVFMGWYRDNISPGSIAFESNSFLCAGTVLIINSSSLNESYTARYSQRGDTIHDLVQIFEFKPNTGNFIVACDSDTVFNWSKTGYDVKIVQHVQNGLDKVVNIHIFDAGGEYEFSITVPQFITSAANVSFEATITNVDSLAGGLPKMKYAYLDNILYVVNWDR